MCKFQKFMVIFHGGTAFCEQIWGRKEFSKAGTPWGARDCSLWGRHLGRTNPRVVRDTDSRSRRIPALLPPSFPCSGLPVMIRQSGQFFWLSGFREKIRFFEEIHFRCSWRRPTRQVVERKALRVVHDTDLQGQTNHLGCSRADASQGKVWQPPDRATCRNDTGSHSLRIPMLQPPSFPCSGLPAMIRLSGAVLLVIWIPGENQVL